tara:strand:- start:114 stop:362 length:249 start_codon:yes stop_codon:yes gene_type:complete
MEFEIVKGVPLPKNSQGKPRKYNIPIEDMTIGDMIKIPMSKVKMHQEHKILRNFVYRYQQKNPKTKFTVRQLDDGLAVWRIK